MKPIVHIENNNLNLINFGSLCESVLFYKNVILVTNGYSFSKLVQKIGFDQISELVKNNVLEIYISENHLGFSKGNLDSRIQFQSFRPEVFDFFDEEQYYSGTDIETELTNGFKEIIEDENEVVKLVKQSLSISKPFRFPEKLREHVNEDLLDYKYFLKVYENHLKERKGVVTDNLLNGAKMINRGDNYYFDPNYKLLKLGEEVINPAHPIQEILTARENLFISTHFGTDILCSPDEGNVISYKCESILEKIDKRQREIRIFQEYAFNGMPNISKGINEGNISFDKYLQVLNNSEKFKKWLGKYEYDDKLLTEYINEITKGNLLDKINYKVARWVMFTGIGFATDAILGSGGIATSIGLGISMADTFLLDRMFNNWKPNQFIDTELKNVYQ